MSKVKGSKLSKESFFEAAECLRVLAHPIRLKIIDFLSFAENPAVGEIAEHCEIQSNHASEHLRLMQRCNFLTSKKEGKKVLYEIADEHVLNVLACIKNKFGV